MIINARSVLTLVRLTLNFKIPRNGNIKISSISKIRKIRVTKKNCKEKNTRLLCLGLKPHSNGLIFSKSKEDFVEIVKITSIKAKLKKNLVSTS